MIHVLSLNPCTDKTAALDRFEIDSANRIRVIREDAGGKGMNVSRMCANLSAPVLLTGFSFEKTPGVLEKALEEGHVPYRLLSCPGALRVNLKILDRSRNDTIEINEESAPVTEKQLAEMEETLLSSLQSGDFLVLTGSLPKGAPVTLYRTLTEKAHEKGCFVALDCDGDALKEALKASPDLIKPNRQELRRLFAEDPETAKDALPLIRRLIGETGVRYVCHSRGAEGAMLVSESECFFSPPMDVPVRGVYGAGDAMLSGVCVSLHRGDSLANALRLGAASSHATIQLPGTHMGDMDETLRLYALAKATPM